jgi:uncharacterized protein
MGHPNETVVLDAYEAFAEQDGERLFSLFADDVAFHVPGRSAISGAHRGRDGVVALFGQLDTLTEGTFELEPQHVVAGDEFVVALVVSVAEPEGRAYEGRDVHVWRVAEGKLAELWVHPGDQYEADAFFSAARAAPTSDTTAGDTTAGEPAASVDVEAPPVEDGVDERGLEETPVTDEAATGGAATAPAPAAGAAEETTEVVESGGAKSPPSTRARRTAAKALGHVEPPAAEGDAGGGKENGSGRRPKRGAPRKSEG